MSVINYTILYHNIDGSIANQFEIIDHNDWSSVKRVMCDIGEDLFLFHQCTGIVTVKRNGVPVLKCQEGEEFKPTLFANKYERIATEMSLLDYAWYSRNKDSREKIDYFERVNYLR